LSMLPMMITSVVQASVSVKRINQFMRSGELNPDLVKRTAATETTAETKPDAVRVSNGSFRWEAPAAAAPKQQQEVNGSTTVSKINGEKVAEEEGEKKKEKGEEEETEKLLNGSATVGTAGNDETPREIFSLKDINIR
jgi:hypothetical protein